MERWSGKLAVVTGASSGIGLATAKKLKENGVNVVGLARRAEEMEVGMMNTAGPGQFFAQEVDITDECQVQEVFNWIESKFGNVDILVNCAGRAKQALLEDIGTVEMADIISVNLMGLLYCTRCALVLMKKDLEKESHIVNINGTPRQSVPYIQGIPLNVYPASKFAVTAICQTLIQELSKTKIKVSSINPGVTCTDFYYTAGVDANYISMQPYMSPEDVANAILQVLSAPEHVAITELTIVPVGQVVQ